MRHDWRCIRSVAVDIGHWVKLAREKDWGQQGGVQEFHHPYHLRHDETASNGLGKACECCGQV